MATVAKKPVAKRKPKDNSVSTQFLYYKDEDCLEGKKKKSHRNIFNFSIV